MTMSKREKDALDAHITRDPTEETIDMEYVPRTFTVTREVTVGEIQENGVDHSHLALLKVAQNDLRHRDVSGDHITDREMYVVHYVGLRHTLTLSIEPEPREQ